MSPNAFPLIEPLEARIAPAGLIIKTGVPGSSSPTPGNTAGETDYVDTDPAFGSAGGEVHFVSMSNPANATDPIVQVVGNAPNTYYIKLFSGDRLQVFSAGNGLQDFISGPNNGGIQGNLVAFFYDADSNNEVSTSELTGIALGKDASVVIGGNVHGDIVSNYNDSDVNIAARTGGKLGGTAEPAGNAHDLLLNPIKSVIVAGNVEGNIISGGNVSAAKVIGKVNNVLGGSAANAVTYDFNGSTNADGGDVLAVTPADSALGVSLAGISVVSVGSIKAGDGGAAGAGGGLTGINIIHDTDGFVLQAGSGGIGNAAKTAGGAGGKISSVLVQGFDAANSDPTDNDAISITSGTGGNAFGTGKTGIGGTVSKVYVGYDSIGGKTSVNTLHDTVLLKGGNGGSGKTGALGGGISDAHLFVAPNGSGNNIQVTAGSGGNDTVDVAGAKAGAGGAITTLEARNVSSVAGATLSQIIVKSGSGGTTMPLGAGGSGGAISNVKLLGFDLDVEAGIGTGGNNAGGAGGAVKTLTIEEFKDTSLNGIQAQRAFIAGGIGGTSTTGKGGAGGAVVGVTILNADFNGSSSIKGGDGANSGKGAGGAGGAVSGLRISDIAIAGGGNTGTLNVNGGGGGKGPGNGGAGGALSDAVISARKLTLNAASGIGGDVTGSGTKGNGGAGGKITSFAFATTPEFDSNGVPVFDAATIAFNSGKGGNGLGTGMGGAGGDMKTVSLIADSTVTVLGGTGGDAGATGTAGKGASVVSAFLEARNAAVSLTAGNGGTNGVGAKAGAGGTLNVANLRASTTILARAGDGTNGGAGGSLTTVGFANPDSLPTSGAVTLQAGNVTGTGAAASNGGSITNVTGFAGTSGTTLIKAGTGGAIADKAAVGGSITGVNIYGGGGAGAVLNIEAGDAANSASAKVGGTGGSVKNVSVGLHPFDSSNPSPFALDTATVFHHIAAGNGGNTSLASTGKGGLGGSVTGISVHHDIGVRSGRSFGYGATEMGGIFAGMGGVNTTVVNTLDGASGNVTTVTANAIASIVAGRPSFAGGNATITKANLVTKVDNIELSGLVPARVDGTGAYKNFATANLVGGNHSANPNTTANADTFDPGEYVDGAGNPPGVFGIGDSVNATTDGFIAAITLTNKRNFVPEALLTVDSTGASVFLDYNHTNGQPA